MTIEGTVSVIVPVTERYDPVPETYTAYHRALMGAVDCLEFVYVLDGSYPQVEAALKTLIDDGEPIRIVKMARPFGEATALVAAFEHCNGQTVMTLPAYLQVDPRGLPSLLHALKRCDMAVARRWPRKDSALHRLRTKLFHWPLKLMAESRFRDLGCSVRAMTEEVVRELHLYGDLHRFIPLLAEKNGFRVEEIEIEQADADRSRPLYQRGTYLRRLIDLITIFFLVKFTKKPLRFFGLVGSMFIAAGGFLLGILVVQRLFFAVALADRPMLLLASLMAVLGVQIFAIGLLGEIIIFTHAARMKEYRIERIIN